MSLLTAQSIVERINLEVAEAKIDNKTVLLNIEQGDYYNFNATSSDIWTWIAQPLEVQDLCKLVATKYSCTEEECFADVLDFLNELIQLNLLKIY